MEKLQELVRLVTIHKEKKIEIFDTSPGKKNQSIYNKFFNYLVENPKATDIECASLFCNTLPADKKYLMLKSRLQRKLMNTTYFFNIEKKDFSAYMKADFLCNRIMAMNIVLHNLGANKSLHHQVSKGLHTAIKFEMFKYIVPFTRLLTVYYSTSGNTKEVVKYTSLNNYYSNLYLAETKLLNFSSYIISHYTASASEKPFLSKEIRSFLEGHEQTEPEDINNFFHYTIYKLKLQLLLLQIEHDYATCLATCEKVLSLIKNAPLHFFNTRILTDIYMIKLGACVHLQDYDEGIKTVEAYKKVINNKTLTWFKTSEYHFLFLLKMEKYIDAYKVLQAVTTRADFKNRPENMREKWLIFNYHLQYIAESGHDKSFSELYLKGSAQKTRLSRLLNDIEVFKNDKSGLYVSILILYFAFLILYKEHALFSAKAEGLRAFSFRRLNKGLNTRTLAFIKILLKIEKAGFHKATALKITKPFYNTLILPRNQKDKENTFDIEIIPYKIMWRNVIAEL